MSDLAPSKLERYGRAAAYLSGTVAGIVMLVRSPVAVQSGTLGVVTLIVSVFLIVGGAVATVAACNYQFLIEYVCLVSLGSSVAVFVIALYGWACTHDGAGIVLALMLQVGLLLLLSRFGALHRLVRFSKRGG